MAGISIAGGRSRGIVVSALDDFARCVAALYEAALDDARWPAATALVEEAVGGHGNGLVVGEGLGDEVRLYFARYLYAGERQPERVREYFEHHHPHDEAMPRLRRLAPGRMVRIPDLYSEEELRTSPAYHEG